MGFACQIASSCSEYSLQDYCFLSTTIDSYWLLSILLIDKIFFWDLDFYRFLISIDFNQRIKSINTDDIDWFPISIFIDHDHQHTWTSLLVSTFRDKSFWNKIDSSGPSGEPCGQPLNWSFHVLVILLILTQFFRSMKQERRALRTSILIITADPTFQMPCSCPLTKPLRIPRYP